MNKNGLSPIYYRIATGDKKEEKSTGFFIDKKYWSAETHRVKTSCPDALIINRRLQQIEEIATLSVDEQTQNLSLLFAFERLILKKKDCIQKRQLDKLNSIKTTIKTFNKYSLKTEDIELPQIKQRYGEDLKHWLLNVRNLKPSYATKIFMVLRQVINNAILEEKITVNYLSGVRIKRDAPQMKYLTTGELKRLEDSVFENPKLTRAKDLFLFQCYTGLAYSDVFNLSTNNLSKDDLGNFWIVKERNKTGFVSQIPLYGKAQKIIEKYNPFILSITHKKDTPIILFNVQALAYYNRLLKMIGRLVCYNIDLTSHVARKTFATTILNSGSVSIETVAAILGHANTRITQSTYARVNKERISRELNTFSLFQ